jgi:hypothetical protein
MDLYTKLSEIKYPQLKKFSSSSFDWLLDDNDSQTFLEWFCNSVSSDSNLASSSELERLFLFHIASIDLPPQY